MSDNQSGPLVSSGPVVSIRQFRNSHGLTVADLVDRIEAAGHRRVHPDTIRNVELGHKRASPPLMLAWSKALGLGPLDVRQPDALA